MTTGQDQILSEVRERLVPHLRAGTRVQVGLSGGLDSVVLLQALVQLRTETPFILSAIHVHHGLSPNADAWATFCQKLCAELDVPCDVFHLTLPNATGSGVEQVARDARYAAFERASADILCLAHHRDDRAETLLLNLFRGAGAVGLAGLPEHRRMGSHLLLRPLIDLPRVTLQAWAEARAFFWVEDESNENLHYRRNFVRRRVMPLIAEVFPGITAVLARTATQMSEQSGLLNRLAELDAQTCRDASGFLSVMQLQRLPEATVRNLLRYALGQAGVRIPAMRRLTALVAQVMTAREDAEIFVVMGEIGIHVWRNHLWLDPAMNVSVPDAYLAETGVAQWPDGRLSIVGGAQASPIRVCPVGHGQYFHPAGRCRDSLSELFRARGVPPWVRPRLPGLWRESVLCWVAGLGWSTQSIADNVVQPGLDWQENQPIRL